jgi:2-polyprenyl-6-hydroxyphenyl methylase/3-demethylubiquinone-9 3-methyltransferase
VSHRFEFGKNWNRFLSVLDEERIQIAEHSLRRMLEVEHLKGKSFLDVGSGSGLFSLAARRLGARVHSFDYDLQSVACTKEMRRLFSAGDSEWVVEQGSVLDEGYLALLGTFDVVYAWGVLHHTGDMWTACNNVAPLVRNGGLLFISIYNDQGPPSVFWRWIKRAYCSSLLGKVVLAMVFIPYFILRGLAADTVRRKSPLRRYFDYRRTRGMSCTHDWIDWLGGYPFEVAKPEQVFELYKQKEYVLVRLETRGGANGNNEFIFRKS